MQPQNTPGTQNPQYDFILQGPQKPKRTFRVAGLPKPIIIIAAAIAGLFIVIIVSSLLFSNRGSDSQIYVNSIGRAQEISRVSDLVLDQTNDGATKNLAATAQATLSSQQAEFSSYLASKSVKIEPASLAAFIDKKTDADIKTAAQENRLEQTYYDYLKAALANYETSLSEASTGMSATGRNLIKKFLTSTKLIKSSPLLAG